MFIFLFSQQQNLIEGDHLDVNEIDEAGKSGSELQNQLEDYDQGMHYGNFKAFLDKQERKQTSM